MFTESSHHGLVKERLTRIFQFLRAFNDQHHPVPRRIDEQPWQLELSDLPQHPAVRHARTVRSPAPVDDDWERTPLAHDVILTVRRSLPSEPPAPPLSLRPWLVPGWDDPFHTDALISPSVADPQGGGGCFAFGDEPARVRELESYAAVHRAWAREERETRRALKLFEELYELYALMEREGERHELIIGEGTLLWRQHDGDIEHPILLQRLHLEFDAALPEFRLRESTFPPEIYAGLLSSIADVDGRALSRIRDRFSTAPCHPLAGDATEDFLSFLAVQLSPRGRLITARPLSPPEDPVIVRGPFVFQRTRTLGYSTAIEAVLEDIATLDEGRASPALARIVGVDPPLPPLLPPGKEASFAADQIVLSKPANLEQVRIVERLESHGSVLVQGPPGTGKTHTIGNLIGHLLAHGKTVLVTADTTKALRVVRDQVDEKLRPLCVSVLDNDLEGRKQLEEAVAMIADEISHEDVDELQRQATDKARLRRECVEALEQAEAALHEARLDEYRPIVVAGESLSPAEAARQVAATAHVHSWIPGPARGTGPLPLSGAELAALYATNGTTTRRDEKELSAAPLPEPSTLPLPATFERLCRGVSEAPRAVDERLWSAAAVGAGATIGPDTELGLDALLERIASTVAAAQADAPWQLAALHAGMRGGATREPWDKLLADIEATEALAERAQEQFVRHAPHVEVLGDEEPLLATTAELLAHVRAGKGLGALDLLLRARFREYLGTASVGGRRPERPEHFEALACHLELRKARRELALRWERLIQAGDGPAAHDLGADVEVGAKQLVPLLKAQLAWHDHHFAPLLAELARAGFAWDLLLHRAATISGAHGEVRRVLGVLSGSLPEEVRARLHGLFAGRSDHELTQLEERLRRGLGEQRDAPAAALIEAIVQRDLAAYRSAHARVVELAALRPALATRAELLSRLEQAAPGWAEAISQRSRSHGIAKPPAEAHAAFRWLLLKEELERRAARSLAALQARRERCTVELHQATSELIEARAWLAQSRRMTLAQQQALTGWLDTQRAIGKGTGKKAPELKAEARRLMSGCQTAVPVWIMPLSRLVESFDPRQVRFDVVIIDEASQCDLLALVALYLGRQAVVVGDHEQVSPSAVGDSAEASAHLIAQHLLDIPNAHLYDGKLSVYDLARQSFGGMLALREHFRSLPHIIEFSNQLAYMGKILPLRDGSDLRLSPATIAFKVEGKSSSGKVNRAEARAVAALIVAASEQPEYDGATFGVVSLLGQEQAYEIESLLRHYLSPREFEQRRIVCGNAAHFQGDEREVMFLTLVDVADGRPLPLRDQQSFKQRFNVAASRARDQMWVVHSLDPHADLKLEDLRRRLILHAQSAPPAPDAPLEASQLHRSELERAVFEGLVGAGYRVNSPWHVGDCRIDIVVHGAGGKRVALTCDGDRARAPEQMAEDTARQAVLERVGWKFLRIRGSEYLREPRRALLAITQQLEAHGIRPGASSEAATASDVTERVIARARQLIDSGFAGLGGPGAYEPRVRARPRRKREAAD
jgi:very-short-patch-repair endonuclease